MWWIFLLVAVVSVLCLVVLTHRAKRQGDPPPVPAPGSAPAGTPALVLPTPRLGESTARRLGVPHSEVAFEQRFSGEDVAELDAMLAAAEREQREQSTRQLAGVLHGLATRQIAVAEITGQDTLAVVLFADGTEVRLGAVDEPDLRALSDAVGRYRVTLADVVVLDTAMLLTFATPSGVLQIGSGSVQLA